MTQLVTLEDGSSHMFPDDATPEEMSSMLPPVNRTSTPSAMDGINDAAMGLAQGAKEGAAGLIAAPADVMALALKPVSDAWQYGLSKALEATGQMTPEQAQAARDTRKDDLDSLPSGQVANVLNTISGGEYDPTTAAGQAARTLGQFTNAGALKNGVAGFIKNSLIPAAATEAAGDETRNLAPELEPYVRTLTALASPAVEKVGASAASPVVNAMKSPDTQAIEKIAQNMSRSGVTPDQAAQNLAALGPDGTLADVGGENTIGFVRGAAAVPGDAKTAVNQFTQARQEGQQQRILDQTGQSDYHGTLADLDKQQSTQAGPLYKQAFSNAAPVDVQPVLDKLDAQIQSSKGGIKTALTNARALLMDGAGNPDTSLQGLHQSKIALDDAIDASNKDTSLGRGAKSALVGVKNDLLGAMDASNPVYGQARAAYAGPARSMEAAETGKSFMNEDSDVTAAQLAGMSPSERQFARVGMQKAVQDKVLSAPDGSDAVKRIFGNKLNQQKMQALFDSPQDYQDFAQKMKNEATIYKNNSNMSPAKGSQTTPMAAEAEDSGLDAGHVVEAIKGNPMGALMKLGGNLASRFGGMSPAATNSAVRQLLSTDPAAQQQTLSALARLKPPVPYSVNLPGALAGLNNYQRANQ